MGLHYRLRYVRATWNPQLRVVLCTNDSRCWNCLRAQCVCVDLVVDELRYLVFFGPSIRSSAGMDDAMRCDGPSVNRLAPSMDACNKSTLLSHTDSLSLCVCFWRGGCNFRGRQSNTQPNSKHTNNRAAGARCQVHFVGTWTCPGPGTPGHPQTNHPASQG